MQIPLVDLKAQYVSIKPEIDAAVQRVLNNAQFILGQEVKDFEVAFAAYLGVQAAVGVASGTAALYLALLACDVGAGDEVITTAHTFFATAEAISQTGARPVFVDIDPRTYNLNPDLVEAAITPRTRAIVPVHLYGQPADLAPLQEITQRHQLWLIEDAAQAHGAMYQGQYCGSFGHLACFSFYPGKNLGAYGDAGAVVGNDEQLLKRVRQLRDHGRSAKYIHERVGFGERMDALQAAVLNVKLGYLDQWNEKRRHWAQTYTSCLGDCPVSTPYEQPVVRHVYHQYVIRSSRRDELLTHLKSHGIEAGIHYPVPLHRQPAYIDNYRETSLPVTEMTAKEVLSLPMYPEINEEYIARVVKAIRECLCA
jgi:dTDP-4-amino-4,6-dideoxygalactose transaminase